MVLLFVLVVGKKGLNQWRISLKVEDIWFYAINYFLNIKLGCNSEEDAVSPWATVYILMLKISKEWNLRIKYWK